MKLDLNLEEAVLLEQAARMMSCWDDEDMPPELASKAKTARGAHRKLQGALERSGGRVDDKGNWKVPVRRR